MLTERRYRVLRFPLVLILTGFFVVGVFSKRGLRDWRMIVKKNDELRVRIQEIESQKRELERKNYLIQNSTEEADRVVRRVLGYVRPNEMVIEFD